MERSVAPVEKPNGDYRPLRRDAELNLARILLAGRDVFAEHGYEASMEQIASRADVGIGTLYRRFPKKADLFAAVVDAATARVGQIADEVIAEVDPAEAVFEFVRRCVATPSCWRATTSRRPWIGNETDDALGKLLPKMSRILAESQRAGSVRHDVVPTDLVVMLMSVRSVADCCDGEAPGTSFRFLELTLDSMRPGGQSTLPPPMTAKQLGSVLTHSQSNPTVR